MNAVAIAVFGAALLTGCAGVQQSTRMTVNDNQFVVAETQAQLRQSEFLRDRSPLSPPAVVTLGSFTNLSSDLLSDAEKWRLLEFIWPPRLREEKNIIFVEPRGSAQAARSGSDAEQHAMEQRAPTHRLDAELRSAERFGAGERTDLYFFQYRLTALATGERNWTGGVEFKRTAAGKPWN
ncbi:MAG: hypothetical protein JSR77_13260 [Planctomycetes bacterium]|nr:hypothetical protein [Planctomycetota bacterium]